jgi:hypothetical protein
MFAVIEYTNSILLLVYHDPVICTQFSVFPEKAGTSFAVVWKECTSSVTMSDRNLYLIPGRVHRRDLLHPVTIPASVDMGCLLHPDLATGNTAVFQTAPCSAF